jgi:catechol 2,3-dioxygenase-like lactoylglutathione lyase family enzyme
VRDDDYLMASYLKLLVADASRARGFYVALGFELRAQDAVFSHLRWRRHADLFLVAAPPGLPLPAPRGQGVIVCYAAGEIGLDELAARAGALGAHVEPPRATPWHTRELLVTDPDGYRVAFVAVGTSS